jgi:hypothetical protein
MPLSPKASNPAIMEIIAATTKSSISDIPCWDAKRAEGLLKGLNTALPKVVDGLGK